MRFPRTSVLALLFLAFAAQGAPGDFRLSSPDFALGGFIPSRFTCQGDDVSPALEIAGVPAGAKTLALIVEDPDAPSGTFTHWIVWNIPPETKKLPGGAAPGGAIEGTNDFGKAGYSGPCPPSGTHRYFFRLAALDIGLHLPAGASRKDFDNAIRDHVIAKAVLMGRYGKTSSQ